MDNPFRKPAPVSKPPAPKFALGTFKSRSGDLSGGEKRSLVTAVEPVAASGSPPPVPATSDDDRDAQLDVHRRAVLRIKRNAAKQVIELGKHLAAAQKLMAVDGRGVFLHWVRKQCGLKKQTAYNAIAVWRKFSDCPTVGQYDVGALYALAAESCPPAAVTSAAALADNREKISQRKAKAIIKLHTVSEVKPPAPAKPTDESIFRCSIGQIIIKTAPGNTPEQVVMAIARQMKAVHSKTA